MDDVQLRAVLGAAIQDAEDHVEAEILNFAADADDLYLGQPLGNEVEGRSQVVDRATMDAIEWMIPQFMRMFHGSDQPVAFEPAGPEDEAVAAQATQYIGYIYNRDNDGMAITETVLRSALLYRYGVVKRWWDARATIVEEALGGLTLDQVTLLLDEPGVALIEAAVTGEALPGPPGPRLAEMAARMAPPETNPEIQPPYAPGGASGGDPSDAPSGAPERSPAPLFDIRIRRTRTLKRECIEAVPANEFLIDRRAKRIADATLVGHRRAMTRSDLVAMGYDRDLVETLPYDDEDLEARAGGGRFATAQGERDEMQGPRPTVADASGRLVSYYEIYLRVDQDGDGIAELRRIACAGRGASVILDNRVVDAAPFEGFTPIMLPHRLVGLSIADLTRDIQIVKTTLWRQMLDGLYLSTSPVTDIATGALDPAIGLDDFLVRRPGGIRRARDIGGIRESTQQWGGAQAFPMLEYLDSQAEGRTGVSKRSAGLSPDLLNPNVSATASMQMMTAVQARIELIARRFAEGFLKPLFLGILRDVARHQDEVRLVRLRGRFVPMDPRSWNTGMDVSVAVGLGTASQDRRLAMLAQVLSLQREVLQAGGLGGMVTPALLHNTLEDLVRAGELSGVDRYFAPPQPAQPPGPPQPPPPDPRVVELQAVMQLRQAELQGRMQMEQQKDGAEAQLRQQRLQAEIALDRWRAEQELGLKREQLAAEIALKRMSIAMRAPGASAEIAEEG